MALSSVERNWNGNPGAVSFDLKEYAENGDGLPVLGFSGEDHGSEVERVTSECAVVELFEDVKPLARAVHQRIVENGGSLWQPARF